MADFIAYSGGGLIIPTFGYVAIDSNQSIAGSGTSKFEALKDAKAYGDPETQAGRFTMTKATKDLLQALQNNTSDPKVEYDIFFDFDGKPVACTGAEFDEMEAMEKAEKAKLAPEHSHSMHG
jgi:hypothetical protein